MDHRLRQEFLTDGVLLFIKCLYSFIKSWLDIIHRLVIKADSDALGSIVKIHKNGAWAPLLPVIKAAHRTVEKSCGIVFKFLDVIPIGQVRVHDSQRVLRLHTRMYHHHGP